ncbi:MAG TPA: hypothetical protein PKY82_05460 [Pyrinomonadaceae bacterium]|nr:hypothetical protein [Pyrinomonadaceae bacterium]
MNQDFNEQDAIKYFLGELSEAEQMAFEEKFFTNPEFSEWLDEFEIDLVDDYVRGELSATEKMKFEEKYLVSKRRQARVSAAIALWEDEKANSKVEVAETPKATIWQSFRSFFAVPQFSIAVSLILLLAVIGALFFFLRQPTNEIAQKGNENINAPIIPTPIPTNSPNISPTPSITITPEMSPTKSVTPKNSPTPIEKETPKQIEAPQPIIATITLFPSLRSGDETKKVVLKKETKSLSIRLSRDIEGDFEKYQAEVRDNGGNVVSTFNLPNKKSFNISIPSQNLPTGNYKITLKGAKSDGEFRSLSFYNFWVEKK